MFEPRLPLAARWIPSLALVLATACASPTTPATSANAPPTSPPASQPSFTAATSPPPTPAPATPAPQASTAPATSAAPAGRQMVFPTSKLSVGGKSLSDITKDELKAALAQHCAPGFAPMDGISTVLGRWETIGVHCGKPPARDGSSELMLSLDLYRPRPVAQRKDERGDELASPQKRWPEVKGRPRMASRYDEPAAVLIYTATQDAEAVLSKLVQER